MVELAIHFDNYKHGKQENKIQDVYISFYYLNDLLGYASRLIFNLVGLGLSYFSPRRATTCLDEKKLNFYGLILLGQVPLERSDLGEFGRVLSVSNFAFSSCLFFFSHFISIFP